ncbi:hypothetical protein [Rhodococcus opacus]|uniref:Uncharacterized protein n=1 Tax=Rhodococcus opacus TaxID=37919 RepID=A0A2S8J6Z5_RHOOP|nr:hypothetical protein [Rhodococcus opacus]PQP22747.1 hypothetical protein C5613_21970 [Rhodococcus opacus]
MSVFRISTDASLVDIRDAATNSLYTNDGESPGRGWGALSGDAELSAQTSSATPIDPGIPAIGLNHNKLNTLSMRLYFDVANPAVRKHVGSDRHWTAYHDRVGVDLLVTNDADEGEFTVLATTRTPNHLKYSVKPALEDLLAFEDGNSGYIKPIRVDEQLDPDLFLWLIHRDHAVLPVTEDLALSAIDNAESRYPIGWRSKYSGGATAARGDLLANVAKSAEFGPAKVELYHYGKPEGYFVLKLDHDGGFSMYRATEYDDKDLARALNPEALGRRLVEDVWQIILPKIRTAHANDNSWRETVRDEFIEYARAELRKY